MKYKREYSIVTKLSKEQVLDRLQNVTCAYDKCDDRFDFEGKITGNTFTLYQLFDYGSNNQIRPKIYGLIKEEKENRVLELTFTLPYGMKMFFLLAFIGNFIFFCLELTVLKIHLMIK